MNEDNDPGEKMMGCLGLGCALVFIIPVAILVILAWQGLMR